MQEKYIQYTKNGMHIVPYDQYAMKHIDQYTSTYSKRLHMRVPTTGESMKDEVNDLYTGTKFEKSIVNQILPNYEIRDVKPPNRFLPLSEAFCLNSNIKPSELQIDLINEILNRKYEDAFINLQTGYGKTLLSIYLISVLNCKSLVICYSKTVLNQWVKSFVRDTNMNPDRLVILDSSKELYQISRGEIDRTQYDIFLCTPKVLISFGERYGFLLMNDIFVNLGIGIKIVDEAHKHINSIAKINGVVNIKRNYYLSADFSQSEKSKRNLYFRLFRGIPVVKPSEKVMEDLKYIQGIVVEYNSNPTTKDIKRTSNRGQFDSYRYMKYQLNRGIVIDTLRFVLDSITKANTSGKKVLVLVNLIDHVDQIYQLLQTEYGDIYNIGRFHSRVPPEEKEITTTACNLIVSTHQSFGVGVDCKDIKYVINMCVVNYIEDNQAAGRARPPHDPNEECFYFMFIDNGFKKVVEKLPYRLNYLKACKIKSIHSIKY